MRIAEAGTYFSIDAADYFSDPAPEPSLTQSLAKVLLERSPLHAWMQSPRLNLKFEPDNSTAFDIGNCAHALLIGRGKNIEVLEFLDWRTNAAKEAREKAAKEGKIGVLKHQFDRAAAMCHAAREQLDTAGLTHAFLLGHGEVCAIAKDEGIWLRTLIDWLSPDHREIFDLKTTDMSAAPHAVGRLVVVGGWDIQAAMQERILDILEPANAGRRRHIFVCQEASEPYELTPVQLTESQMHMGRRKLEYAITKWRHCIKTNTWSGYPKHVITTETPAWADSQWLEREVAEAEREPIDYVAAG